MKQKQQMQRLALAAALAIGFPTLGMSQTEKIDNDVINKIKEEGMDRSKVMETISYLTDVHGPRLTGAPESRIAGEWAKSRLAEWGLENAHLESWGPFGRGWSLQSYKANVVAPQFFSLIAYPKAWTPSTPTTVRGTPIYLDADTPEELEKYRGKLGRAIVLISPPREVKPWFDPPGARQTDADLLNLANADTAAPRRRRPGEGQAGGAGEGRGRGGQGGEGGQGGAGGQGGGNRNGGNRNGGNREGTANNQNGEGNANAENRQPPRRNASTVNPQLQTDKWQLAYDEGAAAVLEAGRGDGGTVFVASATMPRRADAGRDTRSPGEGGPLSRGPRPWTVDSPPILPQLVVAAEHYNRLVRMIEKGVSPELEIDIESSYHEGDLNSFNIIAEIPGTDLKDEIVMLGAHFDSWHSGTGATDNAIGCGVVMEAVRILKTLDVKPRRTIRVALWTGEEQGLLGSRAYVAEHFGELKTQRSTEGDTADSNRVAPVLAVKPEYEKLSTYFNLDNGAGKIRGIYLQGNEATRPIFRSWLNPFVDMGASTITSSNTGGTDHQSFTGIGLPGFQFIQDPIEYDTRTHHSSMDVYERLIEDDAKQASIIMASFAYNAAMRDEKFPRRPLEGNPTIQKETIPAAPAPQAAPAAAAATP